MAREDQVLAKSLDERYQNLTKQLRTSETALARGASPSSSDIQAQIDLAQVNKEREKLESDRLQRRWYGEGDVETSMEQDEGLLSRALSTFTAPLYGVVGAAEALTGKGTEKGLANIPANIKERELFGDLLRKFNVPGVVSSPLGFALDVMFDPLTWATAGTGALVPRTAIGASKAGLKGAAKALESGALQKTAQAARFVPGFKGSGAYKALLEKTVAAGKEFGKLTGTSLQKTLAEKAGTSYFGLPRLGDVVEKQLRSSSWGDKAVDFFKYRNKDWFAMEKGFDELYQAEIARGERIVAGSPKELEEKVFSKIDELDLNKKMEEASMRFTPGSLSQEAQAKRQVDRAVMEGAELATGKAQYAQAAEGAHAAMRMGGEAVNDELLKEFIDTARSLTEEKTGIAFLDNLSDSFKNVKVGDVELGKKVAEGYSNFISIFKISKIGLTPSAYVNAIAGNPTMAWMYGINPFNPGFFSGVKNAWKAVSGKPSMKFVNDIVADVGWQEAMQKYPGLFRQTFHFNPQFLTTREFVDDAVRAFRDTMDEAGEASASAFKRLPAELQEVMGMREELLNRAEMRAITGGALEKGAAANTVEGIASEAVRAGQIPGSYALPSTTSISSEIYRGTFRNFMTNLEEKGKAGNVFAKFFHAYLTKPMNFYERIDQSYKLGLSHYLSKIGVSENEVARMRRFLDILPEDVAFDQANNLWKLTPLKAMEVSHDVYMNYLAMPAAVKVLRSLPFFGAPFASFMYGMSVKAGRTAINNPAAFSRMEEFLGEFTGRPTPLERQAMDLPYYQWYKRSGMVKLPFFQQNPVYLNVANMVPYYTLNIFQPVERKYENTLSGGVASVIDKMPILKTPEGQLIFDYFIQPILLQEANPQGSFGQPLWPRDAGTMEKAGLVARSAAESLVPGVAGYAGLVTGIAAPETSNVYPSYRWRQIAYATQGKTPLGIKGSEGAVSRTIRALLSSAGVPVYPLRTEYAAVQAKKKLSE